MRNFSSLPTHPSFIFLYLLPLSSPTAHPSFHSRWAWPIEDLPSEEVAGVSTQMFLSAQGAPSLEHQRGENENTLESEISVTVRWTPICTCDASPANFTLRDEEEVNNTMAAFYCVKNNNLSSQPESHWLYNPVCCFLLHFVIQTTVCQGAGIILKRWDLSTRWCLVGSTKPIWSMRWKCLNFTLLLCNHRKLLNGWHTSAQSCFFSFAFMCENYAPLIVCNVVLQNKAKHLKLKAVCEV